jgi:4'-phosphopantetheinyl transferase
LPETANVIEVSADAMLIDDILARASFAVFRPDQPVEWIAAPADLRRPRGGAVHLWKASLDQMDEQQSCLSADERARAGRFHAAIHRQRFIGSRSMLRRILAAYLKAPPADLRFSYGRYGKPSLAAGETPKPLEFNLSHSGGMWLLGVSERAVGVDVEEINEGVDLTSIARRMFPAEVVDELLCCECAHRVRRFFELWTQHEAQCKASGLGLGVHAHRTAAESAEFVAHPCWSIAPFAVAEAFVAAVCVASGIAVGAALP